MPAVPALPRGARYETDRARAESGRTSLRVSRLTLDLFHELENRQALADRRPGEYAAGDRGDAVLFRALCFLLEKDPVAEARRRLKK